MEYKDKSRKHIKDDIILWVQEAIRSRMIDNWPSQEYEHDPLVDLMMGALSSELEQVYGYLHDSENRILDRLIDVLLPEHQLMGRPAHGVAKVMANSEQAELTPYDQFFHYDPRVRADDRLEKRIGFTPAIPIKVLKGKVTYLATDHRLLSQSTGQEYILSGNSTDSEYVSKLFVGITVDQAVSRVEDLLIYLDCSIRGGGMQALNEERALLEAIRTANWNYNQHYVAIKNGLVTDQQTIEKATAPAERMRLEVISLYEANFIQISGPLLVPSSSDIKTLPEYLKRFLPLEVQERLILNCEENNESLIWLEIEFSHFLKLENLLKKIQFHINSFPVINRCLLSKSNNTYFNQSAINAVKLDTDKTVAGIDSIHERNNVDKVYNFLPFSNFNDDSTHSYTIRFGGLGSVDNYNTWKGMLAILNTARSSYKYEELLDTIGADLSVEEWDSLLTKADNIHSSTPFYVILNVGNEEGGKRVVINYWEMDGTAANNIPSQTRLEHAERGEITLISKTKGGFDKLNGKIQRRHRLKSLLVNRGRMVTLEDVRSFVIQYLNSESIKVRVKKGLMVDHRPGYGPTRVVDVILEIPNGKLEDWVYVIKQLEKELAERSSSIIPYRVQLHAN